MTVLRLTARLLRRGLAGLAALLLGVAVFELVNPFVADSLGGPQGLEGILRSLPPALQAFTKSQPEFIAVSGLAGYLSLGFTHPLYLTLASAALVGFGARTLAGEMERGTIQLALSRPISRFQVYAARVLGVVVVAVGLAIAGPAGMLLGMRLAQPEGILEIGYFVPTALATLLLFWAIGGLTLLGSAAASTTGRVVAWATAALVLFYFIDYFATLWAFLEPLEPLSIFAYYDPSQSLVNGALPARHIMTLGLVGLGGAAGGLAVFVRRDLPT